MAPATFLELPLLTTLMLASTASSERSFTVDYENNQFLKDGLPFKYVAGEIHYFRVRKAYWRDRLEKLKASGCTTVTTYVEWSHHEPWHGKYIFSGNSNLSQFLSIAQDIELTVILRPGPYICTERDFGGFPPWLLTINSNMKLRTFDPNYIYYVDKWFRVLMPVVQPHLYGNGGNIIMVQIENEYGSYLENDVDYMSWLRDMMNNYVQNKAVLFTTDGPTLNLITRGMIPGVLATVDFNPFPINATNPLEDKFLALRMVQPKGPLVNSELYTGWISYWGKPRAQTDTKTIVDTVAALMINNISFSMYMMHGGTNFAFTSGSLTDPYFVADITSYDYDAPISEAGDLTPKYEAIRETIIKYLNIPSDLKIPLVKGKGNYGNVEMRPVCSLFHCPIGVKYSSTNGPKTFEDLGQYNGFMSYSTRLEEPTQDPSILQADIRDRAIVYCGDVEVGILEYTVNNHISLPPNCKAGQKLKLLVENMGRRNYGLLSDCTKGLVGNVAVNGQIPASWNITGYPFYRNDITVINGLKLSEMVSFPAVFRGEFRLHENETRLDTFVSMKNWGKGIIFVNGFNLGRYWDIGPQVTLYVPYVFLKKFPEKNIVIVLELHYANSPPSVTFVDKPIWE